jgi:glycosyltransferase involved in cell wall biosynthesis
MLAVSTPRVSVIVPVRNGAATIGRCIGALLGNFPDLFELIVVDDRSTDGTAELARALGAKVYTNRGNTGPAAARNLGADHAQGDILLFIDADVEVRSTTVERILAHFDADPTLAGLFGSYDDEPAAPNFVSQYRNLLHHFVHQTSEPRSSSFWAGCGAVRREIFLAAGKFDDLRYERSATEDIELGLRLWKGGHVVRLAREIQVKHLKTWTGLSMVRSDIVDRAYPWSKLLMTLDDLPDDLNLRWSHRLSAVLVALLAATLTFLALGHRVFYGIPGKQAAVVFALLLVAQLLPLNHAFYRFLGRRRGWLFAVRAVPVHFLYYFYSGVTFVFCWIAHNLRRIFASSRSASSLVPRRNR